ncbi:cation:proton antiporter [Calothrix sp. PCC 6303]|uniref:cation:proton antiporter n=1 Tax=Calothrix sp. PCC 6303 TaxID=1170562 RepID=UPI0002A015BA|nr:cation:proton antiporter [Calothrix sp. PCC 6303]AFZ03990.1 sodium/proton antiporter, CPA1 family [Calothrix sp. PCC 6303]
MLESIIWILLAGFFIGQIAERLSAPPLIGMILGGILLGPEVANVIHSDVLTSADLFRTVAVMVILMKAGLGLDREKLLQQGTVALRLGFVPASLEVIAIALVAIPLFHFNFPTGLLLGCIIGAESPAVIVPAMLRLKSLGWGVTKGIPDAILTGSALSDVLLLLVFGLLVDFLAPGNTEKITQVGGLTLTPWQLLPFQVLRDIIFGLVIGYLASRLLVWLLGQKKWTQNTVQDILIVACTALFLVILPQYWAYYSGYLAVMAMGFFLIELDTPLARKLRVGFNTLWVIAEIFLFVLLGASIRLNVLGNILLPGILILAVGTLIGRMLGWYISTLGSNWNWRERLFLLPGNSAKATVQAAIGAIPLARGIEGGDTILAVAALSILVTAPLGAWAIPISAPKLLQRGEIDPTKVTVSTRVVLLAAVDTSDISTQVLTKTAALARRSDAEVIVLHVINVASPDTVQELQKKTERLLADIRYKFVTLTGSVPEQIVQTAIDYQVSEIVIGKRGHQSWEQMLIGSVSQAVIESSFVPVVVLEDSQIH